LPKEFTGIENDITEVEKRLHSLIHPPFLVSQSKQTPYSLYTSTFWTICISFPPIFFSPPPQGLIVVERILYLYRAIILKLILQFGLIIFYHYSLWFQLPIYDNAPYETLITLIFFYALKGIYLAISAIQISYGYPQLESTQFLTKSDDPGLIRYVIFIGYRAIPFVFELRTLLDWTLNKTTLTLYEYLKLEDIYAELFIVKCRISAERSTEREVDDPQPWYIKLGMGFGLFLLLVLVVWFPLFFFIQGSPGNKVNPVTQAELQFGVEGYESFYAIIQTQFNGVTKKEFGDWRSAYDKLAMLNPGDERNTQIAPMLPNSQRNWLITPPSVHDLKASLNNSNMQIFMQYSVNYHRLNPPEYTDISVLGNSSELPMEQRQNILVLIFLNLFAFFLIVV